MEQLTLAFLREQIIKMAGFVEDILKTSMDADLGLQDLFPLEDQVNRYHKDIDDGCFKFIALKNPAARDLRMAIAIMKMNAELERIGDQGLSIKRYRQKIKRPLEILDQLQKIVLNILKKAIDAFVYANTKNANAVIQADQEVNALYRQLMEECLTSMKEGTLSFEEGFCSMWVAKNLERIGDQSTNIAEDVVFMEKGDDIRHSMESKKRRGESSRFDLFLSQIDKEVLKAPHP